MAKEYRPRFPFERLAELWRLMLVNEPRPPEPLSFAQAVEVAEALTALIVYQETERYFFERTGELFRGDTDARAIKRHMRRIAEQRAVRADVLDYARNILTASPKAYRRGGAVNCRALAMRIYELHGLKGARRGYSVANLRTVLTDLVADGEIA